jgi:hypothetical protein
MNSSHALTPVPVAESGSAPRRAGRWRAAARLARWLWVLYALALAAFTVAGLPAVLASPVPRATLALNLADTGITWLLGGLLFWRQGHHWTSLLFAFIFVSHGANATGALDAVLQAYPALWPLARLPLAIVTAGNLPAWATLPDGRFAPRFSRWLVPVALVMGLVAYFPALSVPSSLGETLLAVWFPVWQFSVLAFVFHRFVRHADSVQRQQLKWVVFGIAVGLPLLAASYTLPAVVSGSSGAIWGDLLGRVALLVGFASVLVAILRYRLWDVDVLIRRTLVYSALTSVLALLYFGSVVVIQGLLRGLTDGESPMVIVVSTLIIAALFGPLRARVQQVIDRRFYRRKYDAARTLAAFAASARDETDLARLSDQLQQTVQDTMQPERVSLWLK